MFFNSHLRLKQNLLEALKARASTDPYASLLGTDMDMASPAEKAMRLLDR